jgi:hypothetical protein
LHINGNGFSFQVDKFAKLCDEVRAGFSLRIFNLHNLNDELSQRLVVQEGVDDVIDTVDLSD